MFRSFFQHLGESPVAQESGEIILPAGAYIDLRGHGRLFYRCCPNPDKPTIVLLHGLAHSSGFAWCHTFEGLHEYYNVIAPDLPGHGRSPPPGGGFRLFEVTEAIVQLIDQLDLGRVVVAGYSLGGVVAQYMGAFHADKVAGLVLAGTGYGGRTNGVGRYARPLMDFLVSFVSSGQFLYELIKDKSKEMHHEMDHDTFESLRSWVMSEVRGNNYKAVAEASRELMIYDTRDLLPVIEAPASVLITMKDEAFSCKIQEDMAELIPNSVKTYYDGGHLSCLTGEFHRQFVQVCVEMQPYAQAAAEARGRCA